MSKRFTIQYPINIQMVQANAAIMITQRNSILRYLIRYLFQFDQWYWLEEEQLSVRSTTELIPVHRGILLFHVTTYFTNEVDLIRKG